MLPLLLCAGAGSALADPCKAIPDRGPPPAWAKPGVIVSGPVRHVGDGDSLCIGQSADPAAWIEIRLADFYAPELHAPGGREAKAALSTLTDGEILTCTAVRRGRVVSYDRLVAICRIGGVSLGDRLRRAGVAEGGAGR